MNTMNTQDGNHGPAKKAEKSGSDHTNPRAAFPLPPSEADAGRLSDGRFQPGHRLGGRPKGSTGMSATAFRDSLLRAYQRLGGEEWILQIAEKNPVAVLKMLAHVLPRRVEGTVEYTGPRFDPQSIRGLSDYELIQRANAGAMLAALVPAEDERLLMETEEERR